MNVVDSSLRDFRTSGVAIFLVALTVRILFIVFAHPYHDLNRYELERTAISLATQGLYGNPYAIPTGPTAHVSPGYTILLAGIFRIFGTGTLAEIIKEIFASIVTSLACALLPWVAQNLRISREAGLLSGMFSALLPLSPLVQIDGDWEAPYTALALMLVCVLTRRLWQDRVLSNRQAVMNGFCWGMSLLFAGALLALFFILLAAGFWFCRAGGLKRYLRFACVEAAIAVLCLTPWAVRNERALRALVWTRSNFGLELRVSNNDFAYPDQRLNSLYGVYNRYHPLQSPEEAAKVRNMGEILYNAQAAAAAKDWIRNHPRKFLALCVGRFRCFWFYPDPSRIKAILMGIVVVLGVAGLYSEWKSDRLTAALLTTVLIIYPLPSYLVHVGVRQQYPIQWILTLLGAGLVVRWGRRWVSRPSRVETVTPAA
ncbi:MAG: hypothetical protein JO108_34620 [Acidobacteriaceae bacterium]|nr:hypothetical protein [Acidobacteriaceae bacterium]